MMRLAKLFVLLSMLGLAAGCKIAVIAVEGGEVLFGDSSGVSDTCTAGSVCFLEVADTTSSLAFYAQADAGWEFVRWISAEDFWCQGSKNPLCELSLVPFAGVPAVEDLVASARTFYVMPLFQRIPPTVSVNGKEWYQPIFFVNHTWNEINAVCPSGVCNGSLNGYDLTGWTWATTQDTNELFNYYIGREELGPGAGHYYEEDSSWAPTFFASRWRWVGGLPQLAHSAFGLVASEWSAEYGLISGMVDQEIGGNDRAHSDVLSLKDQASIFDGAWFYRSVP